MEDQRRQFALRLLGEEVDPSFRCRVPAGEPKKKPESHAAPKANPVSVKPGVRIVKSACYSCNTCCEVLVFIDEATGQILKVEGDPESPISRGLLCAKGLASRDLVYNPGRLRYPLKRTGERGEGKWERISWDEALDRIAEKLLFYREARRSPGGRLPPGHYPGMVPGLYPSGQRLRGGQPWRRRLGAVSLAAAG